MELSFANGVQEYTVHGVKGDVIIRFNPTDGAFIQRLYNAFDTLDKKQDKYADEVQKCGDRVEIFNIADRRDKEMREIIDYAKMPFIIKGIMTVSGAKKALEAGASGIVVSNHGGRVLDQCPATAEVLPEIVDAVGKDVMVLVDGGIRTGMDVFKALALGAKGVLIARPFVNMVYGGGLEGPAVLVEKLKAELADTMLMCGAHSLAEIDRSMVR